MGEGLPVAGRSARPLVRVALARVRRILPGVDLALRYQRRWLRDDLVAGIVLTAVLVPAGMGYATAMGLPPIAGLYASILPLLAYALIGPSRILVVGPDSSLVPLVAAAVIPLTADVGARAGWASALAVLAGVIVVVAGAARLGSATDLLSIPVRVAYLDGIAALVIASQLPMLFGFSVDGQTLVDQLGGWLEGIRDGRTNLAALAVGLASLAAILAIRRWRPRIPGILVAVVGAALVSFAGDLSGRAGIAVVGVLPQGLPLPAVPPLDAGTLVELVPAALSIALVSATDMTVLSKTYATRGRYTVDEDRELVGLGAANLASGLFGGFAISSSATRTPIVEAAGSRTQLTGIVAAVAMAGLLLLGPGLLAPLPVATLAAVVIAAGLSLVDLRSFARLWRVRRDELAFALACFLGVVLVGVVPGVLFAVVLSMLAFVRNAWQPHDAVLGRAHGVKGYHDLHYYPEARQVPGLLLYRFDAPLFFANGDVFARRIRAHIAEAPLRVRWVVVAAEPITDVDTTAAEAIEELLDQLEREGITLAFAELKDPVKDRLRLYGTLARIGDAHCFPTVGTAVDAYVRATGAQWTDWEEAAPAKLAAKAGEPMASVADLPEAGAAAAASGGESPEGSGPAAP